MLTLLCWLSSHNFSTTHTTHLRQRQRDRGHCRIRSRLHTYIHFIDIIRPLPPSLELRYCLTVVYRFTRRPEVTPFRDITTETMARAFFESWICRFGCPQVPTTIQGGLLHDA